MCMDDRGDARVDDLAMMGSLDGSMVLVMRMTMVMKLAAQAGYQFWIAADSSADR